MKKTLLASAIALTIVSGAAQSATLVAGQNYTMEISTTGSCFTFGNCVTSGIGGMVDNDSDSTAATGSANPGFGSAIAADTLAGKIGIATTSDGAGGVNFTVTSFNMDTYLGTAGGAFATQGTTLGTMGGSVDANGHISLDLTGRDGMAQYFNVAIGQQPWNAGASFTSGGQSNGIWSLGGSQLAMDGSAKVVSSDNVGPAWLLFDGTPYTEVFSMNITGGSIVAGGGEVPVPAAAWLFGSGLLGLVGIARRKKSV